MSCRGALRTMGWVGSGSCRPALKLGLPKPKVAGSTPVVRFARLAQHGMHSPCEQGIRATQDKGVMRVDASSCRLDAT